MTNALRNILASSGLATQSHDTSQAESGGVILSSWRFALGLAVFLLGNPSGATEVAISDLGEDAHPQEVAINNPAVVDHRTNEALCTDCDKSLSDFKALLKRMQEQHAAADFDQEQIGDFVTSRLGIMIHRNCFDEYDDGSPRWQFDVVEAVDNSLVKGMSCLAEGEEYYSDPAVAKRRNQPHTSTKYSIFPQFLKYMDRELWTQRQFPFTHTETGVYTFESCEQIKMDPFYNKMLRDDCEMVQEHANRPKLTCEVDIGFLRNIENAESQRDRSSLENASAYASIGRNEPLMVNYRGTTKVYNGPFIALKKHKTRDMSRGKFESVVFHEMFHNLGYEHSDSRENMKHNDYATLCESTCFRDVHKGRLIESAADAADGYCFDYKPSGDVNSLARRNRRIMGGTK